MLIENILEFKIAILYTSSALNMQVINFIPHPISTTNGERESMNVSISSIENKPHIYISNTYSYKHKVLLAFKLFVWNN